MGAGKSTLGQRVAADLDVPFFDTDTVIAAQLGMTVPDIFRVHGEMYFRHYESDVLRQTTFYPKALNATGAGLPVHEDNMQWMNRHGITIYLQWPDEAIRRHLMLERASRPLLSDLSDIDAGLRIRELLAVRKPVYEQAAITLELAGEVESDTKLLEKACRYVW